MIRCKKLEKQILSLGFDNYKAILHTADPWQGVPISKPPAPNAHVLRFFFDEFNIGYIFIVGEGNAGHWVIHSINAGVQVDTARSPDGVKILEKTYLQQDGPLPTIGTMRNDISELVRAEQVYERFFLNRNHEQGLNAIRQQM